MNPFRRKAYRLASVTGLLGAPNGWAVVRKVDSQIVAYCHHKDEAELSVKRLNRGDPA